MKTAEPPRRLPVGAELLPGGGVHFRVWASRRKSVEVVIEGEGASRGLELEPEEHGYFSGLAKNVREGALYRFRLDREGELYPDPASRSQPQGPHGPSAVVSPDGFEWNDSRWKGIGRKGQIIYEMHVGTFTTEGTWEAAARELEELASLGVTVIEMMPIADFSGEFGWGYDGVNLFAPTRLYGSPDDLRRFIARAHSLDIGVILDVVYNHLGPDGNYLRQFSEDYFTDRYVTEWGDALNFDGPGSSSVREFFISNAGYWIDEFHFDGLRLDATQSIFDDSEPHILLEVTRRARECARGRDTLVVAENESQHSRLARPVERDGYGIDALWNDDFHHSAIVALTGRGEAYYSDHRGAPQEFISAAKWGYLFQGQRYSWQKQRRGTPAFDLSPAAFINFIQNHDQVANSGSGKRVHLLTSPGRYRAMTALMLLAPGTPMLFQGQEFAASSPFLYFADHDEDLAIQVRLGRAEFLAQFPSLATAEAKRQLADPAARSTFERCKLDLSERAAHKEAYDLHRDLISLRRGDPALRAQRKGAVDGAVLGQEVFVLRFFGESDEGEDRLLIVNLGRDLKLEQAPEPLLAPPEGKRWALAWSSEDPRYGGAGALDLEVEEGWFIPGHAATVMKPAEQEKEEKDE
jgi:maltooligosyltrehalose trehalohydrolase